MKIKRVMVLQAMLVLVLIVSFCGHAIDASNSSAQAVLDLDSTAGGIQATIRAAIGEEVGIDVIAQDAVTLKSWSFKMNYDPAKIKLVTGETYEGNFVKDSVNQTFYLTDFDQVNGILGFDLSSFGGTPPSGTGIIVHVTFEILSTDTAEVTLSDVIFFDVNDDEDDITANSTGGVINPPIGISGTVTGGTGGTVYVVAMDQLYSMSPIAETEADANGNYLLSGLANGSYYIFAFRDLNADENPDYGEYQGVYGAPTSIAFSGTDVEDVSFTLYPSTDQGPQINFSE